jgi:hypothetical protein
MLLRLWSLLFFGASLCCLSAVARGDGGAVVFSGESGPLRVTVFVEPVPPRAGSVDLSLLVQDTTSLEVIETYTALLRLTNTDDTTIKEIEASMSRAVATNRLFKAAALELSAGNWQVTLDVDQVEGDRPQHTFIFPLQVVPPQARFWDVLIWILLPAIPLLLFLAGRIRRVAIDMQKSSFT